MLICFDDCHTKQLSSPCIYCTDIERNFLLALLEDEEEPPSLQQRPTNTNTNTPTSTQAMRIILEEDENSESSPSE